ncbi:MAG: 30S ribosomal protein S12 methylthiotransferase RimO, partial [Candidatus Delongbacteria bacterium]|nr:30S ribosomal protein S12 methylthiotransferase RimO [Candidatus Delongbacteria bacterium]
KKLYVIGCLSERYMKSLKDEIPEVDKYFGVNDMNNILKEFGICFRQDFDTDRILTGPGHYAYLKVSEGCDRNCAFCAIPFIRGRCISRPLEELVEEARLLAESGVKELILVAQDLTYYGIDLYKTQKLPDLITELLKSGYFEWIRLHYLYPAGFPQNLIPVIRDNPVICNYIDLPVQHISDRMLKIMKRSHGRHETEKLLTKIRKEIPDACIRTTMIVGHPGEREEDFRELRRFTEEFRFDRLGVFTYSNEEGTYSYKNYKDDIPGEIKEARLSELMELQQSISAGLNEKRVGQTLKVVIDRREGDFLIGRTEYDSPEIDQEVLINDKHDLKPGNFYDIRITKALDFDLLGEPEAKCKRPRE